jgi:hypothetical protein
MIDFADIIAILVLWFVISFVIKFVQNYSDIAAEREEEATKFVFLQIDVEHHKGLWYGWYISDTQEAFVAQGATYEEAVNNCKKTLERKNPEFKIVFRFERKYNEQPALQS